jgi:hypothetical protein
MIKTWKSGEAMKRCEIEFFFAGRDGEQEGFMDGEQGKSLGLFFVLMHVSTLSRTVNEFRFDRGSFRFVVTKRISVSFY